MFVFCFKIITKTLYVNINIVMKKFSKTKNVEKQGIVLHFSNNILMSGLIEDNWILISSSVLQSVVICCFG